MINLEKTRHNNDSCFKNGVNIKVVCFLHLSRINSMIFYFRVFLNLRYLIINCSSFIKRTVIDLENESRSKLPLNNCITALINCDYYHYTKKDMLWILMNKLSHFSVKVYIYQPFKYDSYKTIHRKINKRSAENVRGQRNLVLSYLYIR